VLLLLQQQGQQGLNSVRRHLQQQRQQQQCSRQKVGVWQMQVAVGVVRRERMM
jgi:hypothetical protein